MEKNKSVGIVTICDPIPNYGNRLQNYAVQTVLNKMGFDTVTLDFEHERTNIKEKAKYVVHVFTRFHFCGDKQYWKSEFPKMIRFNKFNKKYIRIQKINSLSEITEKDYYVLGSDQVWNPKWFHNNKMKKDMFLLSFAASEKKVCFAPSFGTDHLPDEWKAWFQTYLNDIPYISVREEAGARIVKELTNKDADVIIDPTLMLNADDWIKIEKCPKKIDCSQPYILSYFLGGFSDKAKKDIEEYTAKYGLKIYNIMDKNNLGLYASGPDEFVYMIEHASLVLTDSFHACVFSFLFNRPFVVYDRVGTEKGMTSRIDTLLSKLDLQRKYADRMVESNLFESDFDEGHRRLQEERQKTEIFLRKSLHT